jgi:hypothetical protein
MESCEALVNQLRDYLVIASGSQSVSERASIS